MIQPLKSAPSVWSLCWVDLDEPLPVENDFFLPTILLLAGPEFEPLAAPAIADELDQIAAEEFVARVFDDLGAPDQLLVWQAPEWVPEDWKHFGGDWRTKVKLLKPPPHEASLQTQLREVAEGSRGGKVVHASRSAVSAGLIRNLSRIHTARKRRATAAKAVEMDPGSALVAVTLAEMDFQDGRFVQSLDALERVLAEESGLLRRPGVAWWTEASTRPVLRALHGSMLCLWHLGRPADAASAGRQLLELDSTDHLGARFHVPILHLLAGDHELAVDFFKRYAGTYRGDMPNAWLSFAWALTLCLDGDDQGARQKYREGMLANIYIAPRLLDLRTPREDIYHPTDRDEPQSAADFCGSFGSLWDREAAAVRILRETHAELVGVLEALIARRDALAALMDQRYDPDYKAKWAAMVAEEEEFVRRSLETGAN